VQYRQSVYFFIQFLLTTVISRTRNELKTAITAYISSISQAYLQKVFANKIKRVQAYIDARGHHFQTSNNFYKCTVTFRTHPT